MQDLAGKFPHVFIAGVLEVGSVPLLFPMYSCNYASSFFLQITHPWEKKMLPTGPPEKFSFPLESRASMVKDEGRTCKSLLKIWVGSDPSLMS